MSNFVESNKSDDEKNWPVIAGIILSVVLLGAFGALYFAPEKSSEWIQNLGNLGQLVSGVFAPLAFVWVVVAVILQSRELRLQREELMLTREEMKNTREVFELQKEEMKRAADENREQTRIMTENLQREAERQVYAEVDILLYSLALYIVANSNRSLIKFANSRFHIIDASGLESTVSKENYDRVFLLLRNELQSTNTEVNRLGQIPFEAAPGCRDFLAHGLAVHGVRPGHFWALIYIRDWPRIWTAKTTET